MTKDGDTVKDDRGTSELLNLFFVSVFTEEDKHDIPSMQDKPFQKPLEDIEISEAKVKKLLQKFKLNKSQGPDEIHNEVLYEIKQEIVKPLADLFRGSLDSGVLPKEWKVANLTTIFKKGKKIDPNNYRPVSLTSNVCKMMETLIRDELEQYLENQGSFCSSQHGFRKAGHVEHSYWRLFTTGQISKKIKAKLTLYTCIWITERRLTACLMIGSW